MASVIVHLAIAKKVLEHINVEDQRDYYLGSIAPDIAKQIGQTKNVSHFIFNTKENVPNLDLFIE